MNNRRDASSRRTAHCPRKAVASRWVMLAVLIILTACNAFPTLETPTAPTEPSSSLQPAQPSLAPSTPAVPTQTQPLAPSPTGLAEGLIHVEDEVVRLAFEVPQRFGSYTTASGGPGEGRYCEIGNYHEYQWEYPRAAAGGRSADCTAGREGMLTDFKGFGSRSPQQVCADLGADICMSITDDVLWMVVLPKGADICLGGPQLFNFPTAVVAVDLPDNPQISGFVIAERFFSDALEAELYEPLGGVENFNRSCDEAAIQAFETKREEILRDLTSGSVEAKTLANMESLLETARSIRPLD